MPTKREREYYAAGYRDGRRAADLGRSQFFEHPSQRSERIPSSKEIQQQYRGSIITAPKKRKLSAWNKYVKANSKKPRFRYRNGKLNLKKMAVAFRKTPAGKKKRR